MKVCFIAWERFSYGGVSRAISNVVNSLNSNFNYDISILCLKEIKSFRNVYNIDIQKVNFHFMELTLLQKIRRDIVGYLFHRFSIFTNDFIKKLYPWLKYSKSYLFKIASHITENQYDIVIFASGFEDCIQLAVIKNRLDNRIKLVAWSHASFKGYFEAKGISQSINQKFVWSYFYKNFDQIVVLSEADIALCKYYLNLTAIKIYNSNSIIPNRTSSLKNKKFLSIGALSKTKGADILIDGFVKFAQLEKEWSLEIYGEGDMEGYIREQIAIHSIENRVTLNKYSNDLVNIYPESSIFLFCSRYEGFGIVQVEAMSCGLPIIAARLPITEELVEKHKTGELFNWGDSNSLAEKMLRFTQKNLSSYSNNGIMTSQAFTIDKISKEWDSMFNSLQTKFIKLI